MLSFFVKNSSCVLDIPHSPQKMIRQWAVWSCSLWSSLLLCARMPSFPAESPTAWNSLHFLTLPQPKIRQYNKSAEALFGHVSKDWKQPKLIFHLQRHLDWFCRSIRLQKKKKRFGPVYTTEWKQQKELATIGKFDSSKGSYKQRGSFCMQGNSKGLISCYQRPT